MAAAAPAMVVGRTKPKFTVHACSPLDVFNLPVWEYFFIVDTRSAEEHAAGAVLWSYNMPVTPTDTKEDITTKLSVLWQYVQDENPPDDNKVVVYGPRADEVAAVAFDATAGRSREAVFMEGTYEDFASLFAPVCRPPIPAHAVEPPILPNLVDELLWLGSYESSTTLALYEPPPRGFGVRVVLNVTVECRRPATIPAHVTYIQLPALDEWGFNILTVVEKATPIIAAAHAAGHPVLVHCQMGISRSASVVAAYMMHRHKRRLDDVLTQLAHRRSCVRPNHSFMRQLEQHEALLFGEPIPHFSDEMGGDDLAADDADDDDTMLDLIEAAAEADDGDDVIDTSGVLGRAAWVKK